MAPTSHEFRQAVAVVHHGERLDRTEDWAHFAANPSQRTWRHDPPLSVSGKKKSRDMVQRLGSLTPDGASPYELIISSPELRCAQTASEIAQELGLPVLFDEDLKDAVSGVCGDRNRAHRSPPKLLEALQEDYPDVPYAVDSDGQLQILGDVSVVDETLLDSASLHCCKAQLVVEAATLERMSVIMVSHDTAVAAIAHHMKKSLRVNDVHPHGFLVASRWVNSQDSEHTGCVVKERSKASTWNIALSAGIEWQVRDSCARQRRNSEVPVARHELHQNVFEKGALKFRTCRSITSSESVPDGKKHPEPLTSEVVGATPLTPRRMLFLEKLDSLVGTSFSHRKRSCSPLSFRQGYEIFQEDGLTTSL